MPALESFHLTNIISGNKEDCPGIEVDGLRVWIWWREILALTEAGLQTSRARRESTILGLVSESRVLVSARSRKLN